MGSPTPYLRLVKPGEITTVVSEEDTPCLSGKCELSLIWKSDVPRFLCREGIDATLPEGAGQRDIYVFIQV